MALVLTAPSSANSAARRRRQHLVPALVTLDWERSHAILAAGKCFLDMLGVFAEFETNLRRDLPRKTAPGYPYADAFDTIIAIHNDTPRKCLRFRTPAEAFRRQIDKHRCP